MGDRLELVVDFSREFCFVVPVSKFLLVVDSVDGFAFCFHFHEQVRVVIWFFAVKVDVRGPIDLEIIVDFLIDGLFMQALSVDSHLLHNQLRTETGSLTLASFPGLLSPPPAIINI